MFNFMDRYKLWNVAAFEKDSGGGGGDSGGGGSSSSDDKPAANTIGQVSATGQYAGDGFEWVDSGSGYLTRTYTGAGRDNNLGQDVIAGGTADKNVKEAIATVSLNEGSQFAGTQASVTDYDALDIFRSQENQTASSSFAEQAGVDNYTPTITYGDDDDTPVAQAMEEESFGDAFARNRAAGADTFTYKGNLYTTDLAPSTPAPSAPTVSYDAFGNAYDSATAAAEADQTMAQQSATANQIVSGTEEDLFEQPVVSDTAQAYLDELGTDFDFGQFDVDAKDPRGDQIVSPTGTGIGQADFSYVPQGVVDTSAKDADLGVGATTVGVTADDLAAGTGTVSFPTTAGGSVTFASDDDNYKYINSIVDAAASAMDAGADLDTAQKIGADTLLGVDLVSTPTTSKLGVGSDMTPMLATELGINFFEGDTLTSDDIRSLADKGFDVDMSGVVEMATATPGSLEVTYTGADFVPSGVVPEQKTGLVGEEYDPRTIMPTSEQVAIATGTAQPVVDKTPQTFGEQAVQALKSTFLGDIAAGLQGGASALDLGSSRLGAYEVINPNTGRTETVRLGGQQPTSFDTARTAVIPAVTALQQQAQTEYEKIDPSVRAEMEASQFTGSAEDLFNLEFPTAGEATGRGVALNTIGELADIGSDIVTGLTIGLPAVFAKSFAEGAGSATQEIDAKLDQMVQSGTLQQDPRFTDAVRVARDSLMEAGVDPGLAAAQAQNEAIEAIRQGAYGEAIAPAGGVAAVGDTFLAGLARPGTKLLPTNKLVGIPAATLGGGLSEGITEGTEQALTNRAMIEGLGAQDVTLGQNVGGAAVQAALAGGAGAGGVRTVTPTQTTDSTVYVPPAATTGQIAQVPAGVETAYEEAAKTMEEAGVRGVGDTGAAADLAPDNLTLAEQLMTQQLEDEGAIDVTELDGLGLTLNEVEAVAERAISKKMDSDNQMLQALADESVLETGGISEELVQEINDKLGPEVGAQVVENAVNRPFVSNEGKTRMEIMLENAKKAGETSVTAKPATGIETALPGPEIQEDTGFDTEQQLELLLDGDQEQQLELLPETEVETEPKVEVETEPKVEVETEPKVEVEVEPETEVEVEPEVTTDVKTTVDIPPVIEEPEEPEVEPEPEVEVEPEVEDGLDVIVPPIVTTDEDGNTVTECPEGYTMIETANGPMCQKTVTAQRQRAGRGVQAYTGIVTKPGARGPGQRRITTTRTERVRPTVRSV